MPWAVLRLLVGYGDVVLEPLGRCSVTIPGDFLLTFSFFALFLSSGVYLRLGSFRCHGSRVPPVLRLARQRVLELLVHAPRVLVRLLRSLRLPVPHV